MINKIVCRGYIKRKLKNSTVIGELPSDFTPEFSDFARTVVPNNGIKTPKNHSEALNLYLFPLEKVD